MATVHDDLGAEIRAALAERCPGFDLDAVLDADGPRLTPGELGDELVALGYDRDEVARLIGS